MTATSVKHPILRLEVIASDGTRSSECHVFCRLQHKSVPVDACCSCVHADAITDGTTPSVDCTIPIPPLLPAEDPTGERIEVGRLLCEGTVVVAQTATLRAALGVLHTEDRRAVAIVDDHNVLVGLVHETSFGRRSVASHGAVAGAMSSAIAVHECTPVRVALRMLAANHLREATVISDQGRPIGLFRDVDGLRWIASARVAQ
jgi:CBS domain-containing protein